MGWLGWPPDQVMKTDINILILAIDGRTELLNQIFCGGKPSEPKDGRPIAQRFREMAKQHNMRYRRRSQSKGQ